jgi:hypothetical protein
VNLLPSIIALGLAALVALRLSMARQSASEQVQERIAASRALALAVGVQSIHFVEEAATGFHEQLGPVFGVPGMPFSGFVIFNLALIVIWVASVPGLRSNRSAAFFAAWFLAIAGTINGIAHPLLAIAVADYFPGLISSPFICGASIWLWLQLRDATRPSHASSVA